MAIYLLAIQAKWAGGKLSRVCEGRGCYNIIDLLHCDNSERLAGTCGKPLAHSRWGSWARMFTLLTTCYLFLGGAGAGALVLLCVLEVARDRRWRRLVLPDEAFARCWPLCAGALALGILCLIVDLGRPDRLLVFAVSPQLTAMTVGAFALVVSLGCAGAFSVRALFDGVRIPRVVFGGLVAMGIVAGMATATYTGVLLQSLASVLFWQTPLLPVVFVLSSLSCGVGLVFLAAAFVETRHPFVRPLARLACIDGLFIALEAACLVVYLMLALSSEGSASAARALLFGDMAPVFWGGVVACGLVVPFALERFLTHGNSRSQLVWIAALVLVGGFALRWCMVQAGSYDVTQMPGVLFGLTLAG